MLVAYASVLWSAGYHDLPSHKYSFLLEAEENDIYLARLMHLIIKWNRNALPLFPAEHFDEWFDTLWVNPNMGIQGIKYPMGGAIYSHGIQVNNQYRIVTEPELYIKRTTPKDYQVHNHRDSTNDQDFTPPQGLEYEHVVEGEFGTIKVRTNYEDISRLIKEVNHHWEEVKYDKKTSYVYDDVFEE